MCILPSDFRLLRLCLFSLIWEEKSWGILWADLPFLSPYRNYDVLFLVSVLLAVSTISVTVCFLTLNSHSQQGHTGSRGIFPTVIVLSIHFTLGLTENLLFKGSVNSWVRIKWCWHSKSRISQGGSWAPKHQYYLGGCYKCMFLGHNLDLLPPKLWAWGLAVCVLTSHCKNSHDQFKNHCLWFLLLVLAFSIHFTFYIFA